MKIKLLFILSYILLWTISRWLFDELLWFGEEEAVVWSITIISIYSIILYVLKYRIKRKILEFKVKNQEDINRIKELEKKLNTFK